MAEAGYRMANSSLGNAMTLALGEVKDGRYTGKMDDDLVRRVRGGQLGKSELLSIARHKSAGRKAKISFKAHQRGLRTEMVNQTGVQGIMMELKTILGERGWDNPDALNLVMQRYGLGEREASQVIELGKEMPKIEQEIMSASDTEAHRISDQAFIAQNASWEGIKRKIGKKMSNIFTEPLKRLGAKIGGTISETFDNYVDDLLGVYHTRINSGVSDLASAAQMGSQSARQKIASLTSNSSESLTMGQDYRGMLGSGKSQMALLERMGGGSFISQLVGVGGTASAREGGMDILGDSLAGAIGYGISKQNRAGAGSYMDQVIAGTTEAQGKIAGSPELTKAAAQLREILKDNNLSDMSDDEKIKQITHKLAFSEGGSLFALRNMAGGKGFDIDILAALGKEAGVSNWGTMPNLKSIRDNVSGAIGGGSLPELARQRRDLLKDIKGSFGKQGGTIGSLLERGGGAANLIGSLYGGSGNKDLENLIMGGGALTKEDKALLASVGATEKDFTSNRDSLRSILGSGSISSDDRDKIQQYMQVSGKESIVGLISRREEAGRRLTDTLNTFGGDSDVQKAMSSRGRQATSLIKAYAGELLDSSTVGRSSNVDMGQLFELVSGTKGKERGYLEQEMTGSMRAGMYAYGDSLNKYKRLSRKGKVSLDSLGFSEDALSAGGASPELTKQLMSEAKGIAAGDGSNFVSQSEAGKLAKLLGSAVQKGGLNAPGANSGVQGATMKMEKAFEALSAHLSKATTTIEAIAVKAGVKMDAKE